MSASFAHNKTLDTPPSSDLETSPRLPPSPPQSPKPKPPPPSTVDRLPRTLHLHRANKLPNQGQESADWRIFSLTRAQFAELEERIVKEGLRGWWEEKERYDWEPASGEGAEGRLVLRMPSAVHEKFTEGVKLALRDGIAELAGRLERREHDEEAKKLAVRLRELRQGGSTTLYMQPPKVENSSQETAASEEEQQVVRRSPDASFLHPDSDMPGLVVEVSYSQQRKDLPRLAESYIIDSQHRIQCVVGLDLPYASTRSKGDKSATISVWRAAMEKSEDGEDVGICRQDFEAVPFRDADGKTYGGSLELSIADLLPFADNSHLTEEETLRIPFSRLAAILAEAEKKPTPSAPSTKAPTRFRKRKRTPEEELDDEREKKFLQQEETELRKDDRADGEWRARRRAGRDVVVERRRSARMVARKKSAEAG